MEKKRSRVNVTEQIFAQVKELLSLGLKPKQIADVIKVSRATISRIAANKDWDAYKAFKYEELQKLRVKRQQKEVQVVKTSGEEQPKPLSKDKLSMEIHNSQISVLKSIDFSLGNINTSLQDIVELLKNPPKNEYYSEDQKLEIKLEKENG